MGAVSPGVLNEERLTWKQVCERYPDQWVVLVDVDWVDDMYTDFRTAIVAGHGPHSDDPFEQAEPLWSRFREMAHLFTGPPRPLRRTFA